MEILRCDDFSIGYLDITEAGVHTDEEISDYLIVKSNYRNIQDVEMLKEKGYSFHDRVLVLEIDLTGTYEMRNSKIKCNPNITFRVRDAFDEEMIDMACKVYDTDRRFHLNNGFDQLIANKVIRAYIEKYSQNSLCIITSTYKDKITGFTTIPLTEERVAENVLGVTEPSIVGKVSAYPLYCETLNVLQNVTLGGYKKYVGRVSTTNAASLNLHFQLGARVIGIEDIYIWRKRNV